jgi:dolichyl-phosphate-mannose--protein O-mannosyl transferase
MSYASESQFQPAIELPQANSFQNFCEKCGYPEISLICISVLVFVSTLSFGFVYDDTLQVLDNPLIRSWQFVGHDFTSNLWAQFGSSASSYYRPVFTSWLRLNYSVFGENPMGWHLTTVAAHAVATAMVFRIALRVLRVRSQAAIAGLFFAVHPVHVENVSWVSGVVDPLLVIFFLASFLCYLNFRKHRSAIWMAT